MRLDTAYAFEMFFKKFEYSSGKLTKLSARFLTSSCSNAPLLDVISADIKSFISISPLTSCSTLLLSFLHAIKTRFLNNVLWVKVSSCPSIPSSSSWSSSSKWSIACLFGPTTFPSKTRYLVERVQSGHTSYLSFFYTDTFWGLKILHSKARKFTTKRPRDKTVQICDANCLA